MTKFFLSAMMILGLQLAHAAGEPAGPIQPETANAGDATAREPAAEKSFFETRTFEDVQDMVQSLTAQADDDAPHS